MAAIIPGYEYDIFISYRQNDNKRDKWVTGFVNSLKDELEATLKNPVSIYFDENPHDGLLETHQVGATLNKKLKCLVFLPIISQTYCDNNCYAWQNELLPFLEMAENDDIGINITLANGNVVSRVLPIKIHELDVNDQQVIEAVLDGHLRAIDFIYSEPGVNRPLKPEDSKGDNLNKTNYHNQINKVANALKEIGTSLINQTKSPEGKQFHTAKSTEQSTLSRPKKPSKSFKFGIGSVVALAILVALYFIFPLNNLESSADKLPEKSIAVIPFADMSQQGDQQYFADGVMEDILTNLQRMQELRVISRTSVEQYRDTKKPATEIGAELKVNYLLEGSVRKSDDQIMITAQLINTLDDSHLWADNFTSEYTTQGIFEIQKKIAEEIVSQLKLQISPEEISQLASVGTQSTEAYDLYLRGKQYAQQYHNKIEVHDYNNAVSLYRQALAVDPNFALAYAGWAEVYYQRNFFREYLDEQPLDSMLILCNKALLINPNLAEAYTLRGQYYYWIANSKSRAIKELEKALEINPNYTEAMLQLADIYLSENDFSESFKLLIKASPLIKGEELVELYRNFAWIHLSTSNYVKAEYYLNEALKIQPDNVDAYGELAHLNRCQGKFKENLPIAEKLMAINPDGPALYAVALVNMMNGHYQESEKYFRQLYSSSPDVISLMGYSDKHMFSYVLRKNGKEEEATQNLIEIRDFLLEVISKNRTWSKIVGYELAKVYAQLGDENEALNWLQNYLDSVGFQSGLQDFALYDPPLETLWNDPRFQQIIQQGREKVEKARDEIRELEASEDMKALLNR